MASFPSLSSPEPSPAFALTSIMSNCSVLSTLSLVWLRSLHFPQALDETPVTFGRGFAAQGHPTAVGLVLQNRWPLGLTIAQPQAAPNVAHHATSGSPLMDHAACSAHRATPVSAQMIRHLRGPSVVCNQNRYTPRSDDSQFLAHSEYDKYAAGYKSDAHPLTHDRLQPGGERTNPRGERTSEPRRPSSKR